MQNLWLTYWYHVIEQNCLVTICFMFWCVTSLEKTPHRFLLIFFFTLGLHSQRSFSSQRFFTGLIYRLSVTYASSLTCGFRPFQKDISPSSHIFHLPEKLIHQIPIRPQISGWKSIVDMCHSLIYYGFSLLCTLCSQRSGILQFVHFKLRMITAFPLRSCLYCTISFCLLFWSSWKVAMWRMSGKKGKL